MNPVVKRKKKIQEVKVQFSIYNCKFLCNRSKRIQLNWTMGRWYISKFIIPFFLWNKLKENPNWNSKKKKKRFIIYHTLIIVC